MERRTTQTEFEVSHPNMKPKKEKRKHQQQLQQSPPPSNKIQGKGPSNIQQNHKNVNEVPPVVFFWEQNQNRVVS